MTQPEHVADDLLVRAIDDELSSAEVVQVELHLGQCAICKRRYDELRVLSLDIESAVANAASGAWPGDRRALVERLDASAVKPGRTTISREAFGLRWVPIAAALLAGVLWTMHGVYGHHGSQLNEVANASQQIAASEIEVDGESFVSLPYSNPDLPLGAPHIVQMEVPVSSLEDAGLVLEPIASDGGESDRSVLADVLLGMDGQPIGVHVVELQ
jgi:hypothetical protein